MTEASEDPHTLKPPPSKISRVIGKGSPGSEVRVEVCKKEKKKKEKEDQVYTKFVLVKRNMVRLSLSRLHNLS